MSFLQHPRLSSGGGIEGLPGVPLVLCRVGVGCYSLVVLFVGGRSERSRVKSGHPRVFVPGDYFVVESRRFQRANQFCQVRASADIYPPGRLIDCNRVGL